MLNKMSLLNIAPVWQATEEVSAAWFPEVSGWFDERIVQLRAIPLLRALVLVVRTGPEQLCSMSSVHSLIIKEDEHPRSIINGLAVHNEERVRSAARVALSARECWFGDPVPFLAANISDWRAEKVFQNNIAVFIPRQEGEAPRFSRH